MRWLLVALVTIHGLIHLMGAAKGFGFAELPQLARPISRGMAVVWLLASLALLFYAALLARSAAQWWWVGLIGVALSQAAILASWSDARFGTIANVVVLAVVAYGFAAEGPLGLRAEYRREVAARDRVTRVAPPALTDEDLAALPEPVRRYLRVSGAVGQLRVEHFTVEGGGRIREGPDDPWMRFTFEQHNYVREPARFFLMDARRAGVPLDVFHAFRAGQATMRVRLLSAIPIVSASGPQMTRAETVTLLNDLCVFAPGALVDPAIRWEPIDARSSRAVYTVGANTVSAVLSFNDAGELVDFVSDDRLASTDGGRLESRRWSTPLRQYEPFGPLRLAARGEGRWHTEALDYSYIELEITDVRMNPERAGP